MTDGKHCPLCGADIGVLPIVLAVLPNRIRCPHCKARLAYPGIWDDVMPVSLYALVCLGFFANYLAGEFDGSERAVVILGVLFAGWVPLELATAWYLRSHKVLVAPSSTR
jgi:hypothetical protein